MVKIFVAVALLGLSQARAESRRAFYSVPVPPEDASVASFDMPEGIQLTHESGKDHLIYHLPPELVGPNYPAIDLLQTPASGTDWVELTGYYGTAHCNDLKDELGLCLIDYDHMHIDERAVDDYLTQKYGSDANLPLRKAVARIFHSDPAGILRYGSSNP